MQILNENNKRTKLLLLKNKVEKIEVKPGEESKIYTELGNTSSSCIKCHFPKCMHFDESKIKCSKITEFPGDKDNKVCPVGALIWNNDNERPEIDNKKCIRCGLCASQCPLGAIYFKENEFIINYKNDSNEYVETLVNEASINKQMDIIKSLESIQKQGQLLNENDQIMEIIYDYIMDSKLIPEKFVRNILIGLGCECAIRRIGDVYTRMDAIYMSSRGTFGAVEVEFGTDTLEASRGILDDISVLDSRYCIPKQENIALVVCLSLPNERQGYWQVIKDINNVLNIKVNTQTLGSLLISLWNFLKIDLENNSYYADYDNFSIRKFLERDLGRDAMISDKFLGILEPIK